MSKWFQQSCLLSAFVFMSIVPGYAAAPFYEGKTIRLIVGFSAGGGFDTGALDVVLDQHRNAMQGRQRLRRIAPGGGIDAPGLGQRLRVEPQDAAQGGAVLIIGSDAVEVPASQLPRGQPAVAHRGVGAGNGGFHHAERCVIAGSVRLRLQCHFHRGR